MPQPFVSFVGAASADNVFATANVNSDGTTNYARNYAVVQVATGDYEITAAPIAVTDCAVLVTLQAPGIIPLPVGDAIYFSGGSCFKVIRTCSAPAA